mmetsp:Transcript_24001/g.71425  ORF Transcript_24001/g.71425 Transcript_24001/m.71425 type:complete len:222 (-) Transcript_24001:76-741(-)
MVSQAAVCEDDGVRPGGRGRRRSRPPPALGAERPRAEPEFQQDRRQRHRRGRGGPAELRLSGEAAARQEPDRHPRGQGIGGSPSQEQCQGASPGLSSRRQPPGDSRRRGACRCSGRRAAACRGGPRAPTQCPGAGGLSDGPRRRLGAGQDAAEERALRILSGARRHRHTRRSGSPWSAAARPHVAGPCRQLAGRRHRDDCGRAVLQHAPVGGLPGAELPEP